MEIITRGERRRSWTVEQKRQIVAESFGPELTATETARKYAISTGQLYTWRHELLGARAELVMRRAPRFADVELPPAPSPAQASAPPRSAGLIEIVLPGGAVVRVDVRVDGSALRRVLGALVGRLCCKVSSDHKGWCLPIGVEA